MNELFEGGILLPEHEARRRYKAIIIDFDGTAFLHSENPSPSQRVVAAICAAKEIVHVSAATSRPIFMARRAIQLLGIESLSSVNDSTQFYDPKTDRIIRSIFLDLESIQKITELFFRRSVGFLINQGTKEDPYSGGELPKNICSLCVPDVSSELADDLIQEIQPIERVTTVKVPSLKEGLFWVSVTDQSATKANSVQTIAASLGIAAHDIIGIGDGSNDIALLEACGLKIAMGNAGNELKARAHFIVPSVEQDGLAVAIERFILNI